MSDYDLAVFMAFHRLKCDGLVWDLFLCVVDVKTSDHKAISGIYEVVCDHHE